MSLERRAALALLLFACAGALTGLIGRTLELNGYYDHLAFVPVVSAWLAARSGCRAGDPTRWGMLPLAAGLWINACGRVEGVLFPQVLGLIGGVLGLALLTVGWRGAWDLRFPLGFLVLALPLPRAFVDATTGGLKQVVTLVAVESMGLVGVPAVAQGTRILLESGAVEVDDACSGLKGLLAFVALGALLARERPGFGSAVVLCAASVPVAFLANLVRVLALTGLATSLPGSRGGVGHALIGLLAYALGLGLLLLVAELLPDPAPRTGPASEDAPASSRRMPVGAWLLLAAGAVLAHGMPLLVRRGVPDPLRPRLDPPGWAGVGVALPGEIEGATYIRYHGSGGPPVDLYLIHGVGARIEEHLPAVCFPGAGFQPVGASRWGLELEHMRVECVREVFRRGSEAYVTIHWYRIARRQDPAPDFVRLKLAAWARRLTLREPEPITLIRITTPLDPGSDARLRGLGRAVLGPLMSGVAPG